MPSAIEQLHGLFRELDADADGCEKTRLEPTMRALSTRHTRPARRLPRPAHTPRAILGSLRLTPQASSPTI